MKIGVYGSAENVDEKIKKTARSIGKEIALKGHILITGAGTGIPYEAVLGAAETKGKCIGFSPAIDLGKHKKLGLPTKGLQTCKKYRGL